MPDRFKIVLVDDNIRLISQLKERMETLGEFEVVHCAHNGLEILEYLKTAETLPDLIFMDIEMPEMDGIEATFRIKTSFPGVKILVLTVFDDETNIYKALKAGADAFILKDGKLEEMRAIISDVINHGAWMSPEIAKKVMHMMLQGFQPGSRNEVFQDLTRRELEILQLLSKGMKNKDVADTLFISASTVKKHIENIYSKLQLNSRVELVNWYNLNN